MLQHDPTARTDGPDGDTEDILARLIQGRYEDHNPIPIGPAR